MKCDEERPICRQCRDFEVECDGWRPAQTVPSRPRKLKLSSEGATIISRSDTRHFMPLSTSPPTLVFENEDEYRYFVLFRDRAAAEIVPYFDSEAWYRLILQVCSVPSIRHAVVAIGALYQTSLASNSLSKRHVGLDDRSGDPNTHHKTAIVQYSRAIKDMHNATAIGAQDLRTTLITCLVIVCFEAFHGNYALTNAQIQTGIALIREWKAKQPDAEQHPLGFSSPAPDVIEDYLIQTFVRLDIHTTSFCDPRPLDFKESLRHEGTERIRNMPRCFTDVNEARNYIDLIYRRWQHTADILEAARRDSIQSESSSVNPSSPPMVLSMLPSVPGAKASLSEEVPTRADVEAKISRQTSINIAEHLQWKSAFEAMLKRPNQDRNSVGVKILTLHFKISYVAMMPRSSNDELTWDAYTGEMEDIITLSKEILESLHGEDRSPKFTLDFGVIVGLYMVGLKCRISSMRRRAITLLLSYPRREGIWDSILAGKLCENVRQMEEEYLENNQVPEWARISHMDPKFAWQERKIDLAIWQRSSADDPNMRERRVSISW